MIYPHNSTARLFRHAISPSLMAVGGPRSCSAKQGQNILVVAEATQAERYISALSGNDLVFRLDRYDVRLSVKWPQHPSLPGEGSSGHQP